MARSDLQFRTLEHEAKKAADYILERYAIEEPEHIVLEAISKDLGAEVVEGKLQGSIARLVRNEDRGLIRVSSSVTNPGRRRFSVAHELGHFVLKHSSSGWLSCAEAEMNDFGGASSRFETQANIFASELLLPEKLVSRRCEVSPVDFGPIKRIADEFQTSITATAIRFVAFSPEVCAVLFSQEGRIKWSRKSEDFGGFIRGWGEELDPWSLAIDYFKKGGVLQHEEPAGVPGTAWLEGWMAENVSEVVEHSMSIPSIDAVLTILWVPIAELED